MLKIIDFGALTIKFLQSKEDTAGSVEIFELTPQPGGSMPAPQTMLRYGLVPAPGS
jgi:hypothetical protein